MHACVQNLCFTKKIRYESRKQLAKARPRVKGQFVRRSSLGLTEGDGISDLLEPVADAAAHEAAREAAEAVMSLAHGKMDVAPEAEVSLALLCGTDLLVPNVMDACCRLLLQCELETVSDILPASLLLQGLLQHASVLLAAVSFTGAQAHAALVLAVT